jgi:hypothetical protein
MFGGRVVAIRNALRELGWDGEKYQALSKNGATAVFNFERVGAGANVVGLSVTVNGETVTDDLSKTPLELAAAIDALAPAPAVVPDAKDAADAAALEAAGFKNSTASTNVWVRSIAGNEGVKLGLNIQIGTDIYRAVKSVTMPGITGASQELGRFDTVEAAIAATQAAADDFEATQQPEPPHKSELVMDALVAEFGWKRKSALTAEKDFGGADTGGEMNPEGKRILIAGFDDTARYIQLDSGWETVFDMDTRDGTPRDVALAFNTRAAVYADSLNPQPVEPEPVIEPVVEPVVEPVIEPTPEPTVEPVAPNAEEEAARLEAERIAALQAANDAAAVVVAAEDAARAAAEEAIAQQAAEAEAAAAALTAAEDLAFVASAAAGEVDFMDKAVTDRLAEIAKTAEAGTELAGLIGQAKTAAKNAFIAAFKAKVG